LRDVRRTHSIIDSHGFVDSSVPFSAPRIPSRVTVSVSAMPSTAGLGTEPPARSPTLVEIRNPATNNNLVGIAPTRGLNSADGIEPVVDRAGLRVALLPSRWQRGDRLVIPAGHQPR